MDTQISVELITKQKVNEFRKEAEMIRNFNRKATGRQERRSSIGQIFTWLFKAAGFQRGNKQIKGQNTSRFESSAQP